jgi:hypothetical protein
MVVALFRPGFGFVFSLGFRGVCQRVLSIGHEVGIWRFFISKIGFFFACESKKRFIKFYYSFQKHHLR